LIFFCHFFTQVGLLGNYCDPLDIKSYVDPGEEEKIYLCEDSIKAGDCNNCDGTYIQPETCQAPGQGKQSLRATLLCPIHTCDEWERIWERIFFLEPAARRTS
jgi:hypothetical protein